MGPPPRPGARELDDAPILAPAGWNGYKETCHCSTLPVMSDRANGTSGGLMRAVGRWSLVALLLNSVIGSGVFGVPSLVALGQDPQPLP